MHDCWCSLCKKTWASYTSVSLLHVPSLTLCSQIAETISSYGGRISSSGDYAFFEAQIDHLLSGKGTETSTGLARNATPPSTLACIACYFLIVTLTCFEFQEFHLQSYFWNFFLCILLKKHQRLIVILFGKGKMWKDSRNFILSKVTVKEMNLRKRDDTFCSLTAREHF